MSNRSADGAGFGPAEPLGSPVFRTGALDRSANHPCLTFSPAAQATARPYMIGILCQERQDVWRGREGGLDFTASVEDNGAISMHPLDVPSVQAAKPKSAKTRMRLTPTVPKGRSATPMTMDESSPIHHRAPSRTRTGNTRIRSPPLYPLSYRGSDGSAPGFAPGRAFDPFAAGAHRVHPRRVSCVSPFRCGSAIVCRIPD